VTLLLEVVGVLAAASVIRATLPSATSLRDGLTIVAVVLAGFALWSTIWPQARDLIDQHSADARLTRAQALALPGTVWGAHEDVLAWAATRLPRRATVYLECPQPEHCSNGLANWIAYRLAPRVFTDLPVQAQWILFYATPPSELASPRVNGLQQYAPGYAIARVAP
jgi:hypothetical protein